MQVLCLPPSSWPEVLWIIYDFEGITRLSSGFQCCCWEVLVLFCLLISCYVASFFTLRSFQDLFLKEVFSVLKCHSNAPWHSLGCSCSLGYSRGPFWSFCWRTLYLFYLFFGNSFPSVFLWFLFLEPPLFRCWTSDHFPLVFFFSLFKKRLFFFYFCCTFPVSLLHFLGFYFYCHNFNF